VKPLGKKARAAVEFRRVCPICHRYFEPRFHGQKTCGGPCARRLVGRVLRARGTPPPLLREIERHRRQFEARIRLATFERFGVLSPRECDLFALAEAAGYQRGYARGYYDLKRKYRRRKDSVA
jgi:hypothetical protein